MIGVASVVAVCELLVVVACVAARASYQRRAARLLERDGIDADTGLFSGAMLDHCRTVERSRARRLSLHLVELDVSFASDAAGRDLAALLAYPFAGYRVAPRRATVVGAVSSLDAATDLVRTLTAADFAVLDDEVAA